MTPPPNPGEETPKPDDDPLGGMDPMAWLESLARRQGANPDELVTGGNLDLPPAPESAPESAAEAETEPVVRAEMPTHEAQPPQALPEQAVPEPAADLSDFTGGMDPMAWLEALARRQGAPTDELVTGGAAEIPAIPVTPPVSDELEPLDLGEAFDLEPLPDEILDGTSPLAWLSGLAATEAGGAPQPVGAESGAKEDPLDGMDPMAWLEALARGEGVSGDEALPEPALDMPQEGEEEAEGLEAVGAALEVESSVEIVDGSDPMAWLVGANLGEDESAEMPVSEPPQAVPEPAADLSDFTGGMDPMAWLEALARRQGAPTDELVTGGAAEIPAIPVTPPVSDELEP
ncbi:MAG: hypothetical protein IT323_10150, partial [Anaerolineae bacterium]|nr:hypothetical protein [Anaerolineae bacterium]